MVEGFREGGGDKPPNISLSAADVIRGGMEDDE